MKKKNIYILAGMMLWISSVNGQSAGENYVKTTSPRIPVSTTTQLNGLSAQNKQQNVTYVDGLGRELQSIAISQSPNSNDVVSFSAYDQYGRMHKSYLPYTTNTSGGILQTNPINDQSLFYQSSTRMAHTAYPYSENTYDNSPLNRVVESSAPGEAWALNNGHTISNTFKFNGTNLVHRFHWDGSNANSVAYFDPNTIASAITSDEHGNLTRSFTDNTGKLILSQQQHGMVADPATGTMQPAYHSTYYVYNDLGQLVSVIPPLAYEEMESAGNFNTSVLSTDLLFSYKYDERGLLVEQKVPGKGVVFTVYDALDRPILVQDANQRLQNEWWFTKYDALGRPVLEGVYVDQVTVGRVNMQTLAKQSTVLFESRSAVDYNIYQGYTNTAFPSSSIEVMIVNYYDDYDYDRNGTADVTFDATPITPVYIPGKGGGGGVPNPISNQPLSRTSGLPTGKRVKIMDVFNPVLWLTTANFYDEKLRVVQVDALNMQGGHEVTDMFYDFEGRLIHSRVRHDINTGTTTTIKKKFVYDQGGRLQKVYQQNDSDPAVLVSASEFNELGQLIEKNLHNTDDGTDFLQSLDFAYNIRGWLTHINNADLNSGLASIGVDGETEEVLSMDLQHIEIAFSRIAVGRNSYKMIAVFSSSENASVQNINNGTQRVVNVQQSTTVDLGYSASTDPAIYNDLLLFDGTTTNINYNNLPVLSGMNLLQVINDGLAAMVTEYQETGVTNQGAMDIIDTELENFIRAKVGLSYFNDDNDDLFGMEIKYNRPTQGAQSTPLYNGNISEIQWNTASESKKRHYWFDYDAKNQITDAWYGEYNASSEAFDLAVGNYNVNGIGYDANGNIQSLNRNGHLGSSFGLMDQLTYSYQGNQVTQVDDLIAAAAATNSFRDGTNTGSDYSYDANGNLTADLNKGIGILYNRLNLPVLIDHGNGNEIHYVYAADGTKLQKIIKKPLHPDDNTWYMGAFIRDNDGIRFVFIDEGTIVPSTNQQSGEAFTYNYHLKDHLGNNRLAFADDDRNGSIDVSTEVLQENHYYPFGMEFEGITAPQWQNHPYKFNGVELEEQFDLNLYMTEFRMHDPQIGRWNSIDPLTEQFYSTSPYTAFANNPIYFEDPSGLSPGDYYTADGKYLGSDGVKDGLQYEISEEDWGSFNHGGPYRATYKKQVLSEMATKREIGNVEEFMSWAEIGSNLSTAMGYVNTGIGIADANYFSNPNYSIKSGTRHVNELKWWAKNGGVVKTQLGVEHISDWPKKLHPSTNKTLVNRMNIGKIARGGGNVLGWVGAGYSVVYVGIAGNAPDGSGRDATTSERVLGFVDGGVAIASMYLGPVGWVVGGIYFIMRDGGIKVPEKRNSGWGYREETEDWVYTPWSAKNKHSGKTFVWRPL